MSKELAAFLRASSPVPVREDLLANYQAMWDHVAAPGTWWSGRERVAIAAEVRAARDCVLCAERKSALSPYSLRGEHLAGAELPVAVVEMVHRLTTDNARLSKRYYDDAIACGLGDEQFVETLSVTITVISVDAFCRSLGISLPPLPAARRGKPTRRRPSGAYSTEAWVPMLTQVRGAEEGLWREIVPNVMRAMSLVPDEVRMLLSRMAPEFVANEGDLMSSRSLSRPQMEFLSARVAAMNECFY